MADNRVQPRHRKRIQVKYGTDVASRIGFTEDISDEGFFLKTALVQKPGSILLFELSMPDGTVVSLSGRVRWAKRVPPALLGRVKGGMGIKIAEFHSGGEAYRLFCSELRSRFNFCA